MKKIIIPIVIVGVVVAVYIFSRGRSQEAVNSTASPAESASVGPSVSASPTASPAGSPSPTSVSTVKTFTVTGKPFSFTPSVINVNKGDTVKIIFKNTGGIHDWVLDEFNVRSKVIQSGQEETIQFVANKIGTFEYYCSVGAHRQMGMRGNLIVN